MSMILKANTFDEVATLVKRSRWFDPAWMSLTDKLGYAPTGAFGLKDSHLTPGYSSSGFHHDLAHALQAVQAGEPWRLAEQDFGLRYTTSVLVLGETYHEPVTTQAIELEIEVLALQARLLAMDSPEGAFDARAMISDQVRLLRFMDDFLVLRINLSPTGVGALSAESTYDWLTQRVLQAYDRITPEALTGLWQKTAEAVFTLKTNKEALYA